MAEVGKVPVEDLAKYDLSSRSAKGDRTQIREALGFRAAILADEVCPVELVEDRLHEALLVQYRSDHIEQDFRADRGRANDRAAPLSRSHRQGRTAARPDGCDVRRTAPEGPRAVAVIDTILVHSSRHALTG
ncbi:hypothetical protein [Streptomyces sp. NPDC054863]